MCHRLFIHIFKSLAHTILLDLLPLAFANTRPPIVLMSLVSPNANPNFVQGSATSSGVVRYIHSSAPAVIGLESESACQILLVHFENPIHLQPLSHNFGSGILPHGSHRDNAFDLDDWYRRSPSHGSGFLGCKVSFDGLSLLDLTRRSLAKRTSCSYVSRWYLGLTEVLSIMSGQFKILTRINAVYGWSRHDLSQCIAYLNHSPVAAESVVGFTTTIISIRGGAKGLFDSTEILTCSASQGYIPDVNVSMWCTSMVVVGIYLILVIRKAKDIVSEKSQITCNGLNQLVALRRLARGCKPLSHAFEVLTSRCKIAERCGAGWSVKPVARARERERENGRSFVISGFRRLGRAARPFGIQNLETGDVAWNCFQEPDLCAASRSNANDLATAPNIFGAVTRNLRFFRHAHVIDGAESQLTMKKVGHLFAFQTTNMTPTLHVCLRDAAIYFGVVFGVLLVNLVLVLSTRISLNLKDLSAGARYNESSWSKFQENSALESSEMPPVTRTVDEERPAEPPKAHEYRVDSSLEPQRLERAHARARFEWFEAARAVYRQLVLRTDTVCRQIYAELQMTARQSCVQLAQSANMPDRENTSEKLPTDYSREYRLI
ncbi:hypothetical protein B0H17DRAFT_1151747 [Mycena rosella]|uniref:Uncharacterized protein n=1 Tax=Mycena rosella TaxID=1033263 RepID=A0AAD7BIA2_MYCRO|nr:hypothetical protein B0H17DRAFT_1151747 [Mycena rosella]